MTSAGKSEAVQRIPEEELYRIQAEFCKGLAHTKRIMILSTLKSGEMSVKELVKKTGIPQANLSQHLGFMRRQGLLSARREGSNTYYSIADSRVVVACENIREVLLERLRQTHELFKGQSDEKLRVLPTVS